MTSGLRQDGTAKSVPRNQFRRRERGQGKHHFPLLSDHEQEWQPYLVHPYFLECADHAYIQSPRYGSSSRFLQQYRDKKRRLHFPAEGDMVCSTRVRRAVSNGPNFFPKFKTFGAKKIKIEPQLVHFKGYDAGFQIEHARKGYSDRQRQSRPEQGHQKTFNKQNHCSTYHSQNHPKIM